MSCTVRIDEFNTDHLFASRRQHPHQFDILIQYQTERPRPSDQGRIVNHLVHRSCQPNRVSAHPLQQRITYFFTRTLWRFDLPVLLDSRYLLPKLPDFLGGYLLLPRPLAQRPHRNTCLCTRPPVIAFVGRQTIQRRVPLLIRVPHGCPPTGVTSPDRCFSASPDRVNQRRVTFHHSPLCRLSRTSPADSPSGCTGGHGLLLNAPDCRPRCAVIVPLLSV